jgi:hypothetical protein
MSPALRHRFKHTFLNISADIADKAGYLSKNLTGVLLSKTLLSFCKASAMASTANAENEKRLVEAQKVAKTNPAEAESIYKRILSNDPGSTDAGIKIFETALVGLGELYRDQKKVNELAELVRQTRSVMSNFAKAKTAKLGMIPVRKLGCRY